MKKSSIFAFGFALLASSAFAQTAQEVTYVEDPAQGYLFNSFKSNWFIQGEGGVAMGFTKHDNKRDLKDRFAPAASLYFGKWFSPIIGARLGADFLTVKGVTNDPAIGVQPWESLGDGFYKTKHNYAGPSFDVMFSLTNWWCGYKPNRVYNAYVYAGGGLYWSITRQEDPKTGKREWKNAHDRLITIRAGLMQEFNLNRHIALGLDLRAVALNNHADGWGYTSLIGEAMLSLTYRFNKVDWSAPVVPVCPPAENCDEYRARLQAADARIADLEAQLKACLNRPVVEKTQVVLKAPLATIYYPCNVYRLTSVDRQILQSVASVMKDNPKTKYNLVGWADNYTGTDAINVRLRHNRVNTVKDQLVKFGVPADQLNASINNGNRVDLGDKVLTLDRCVTIDAAE